MNKNDKEFSVQKIRTQYMEKENTQLDALKKLDAKVKKPAGAMPGFVIYTTNWTAYVTPNEEKINSMKQK